ncbi:Hypothetical predicted protein [Cloeon dipterum]|uniref:Uncharacterized protein n=1 Tax=Cloeon dipterum TaxID=197152 RepID=A0A8S1E5U0_9INSE|nr:Hypothetical predicted protein [Cloeon dipterum]
MAHLQKVFSIGCQKDLHVTYKCEGAIDICIYDKEAQESYELFADTLTHLVGEHHYIRTCLEHGGETTYYKIEHEEEQDISFKWIVYGDEFTVTLQDFSYLMEVFHQIGSDRLHKSDDPLETLKMIAPTMTLRDPFQVNIRDSAYFESDCVSVRVVLLPVCRRCGRSDTAGAAASLLEQTRQEGRRLRSWRSGGQLPLEEMTARSAPSCCSQALLYPSCPRPSCSRLAGRSGGWTPAAVATFPFGLEDLGGLDAKLVYPQMASLCPWLLR